MPTPFKKNPISPMSIVIKNEAPLTFVAQTVINDVEDNLGYLICFAKLNPMLCTAEIPDCLEITSVTVSDDGLHVQTDRGQVNYLTAGSVEIKLDFFKMRYFPAYTMQYDHLGIDMTTQSNDPWIELEWVGELQSLLQVAQISKLPIHFFDIAAVLRSANQVVWLRCVNEYDYDRYIIDGTDIVRCPVELYMECHIDDKQVVTARLPLTADFTNGIEKLSAVHWLSEGAVPTIDDLYQLEFCNVAGIHLSDFGVMPINDYTGEETEFNIFLSKHFLKNSNGKAAAEVFMEMAKKFVETTPVSDIEVDYL